MKIYLILMLLLFTTAGLAESRIITMKDKVRLSLWFQGIKPLKVKKSAIARQQLPEELERPLYKFP